MIDTTNELEVAMFCVQSRNIFGIADNLLTLKTLQKLATFVFRLLVYVYYTRTLSTLRSTPIKVVYNLKYKIMREELLSKT